MGLTLLELGEADALLALVRLAPLAPLLEPALREPEPAEPALEELAADWSLAAATREEGRALLTLVWVVAPPCVSVDCGAAAP